MVGKRSVRKHVGIIAAVILPAILLCGCSGSLTGNESLFEIGTTACSLKEARVYLVNMREVYENDSGLDLWTQIASGDASAEEDLEDLVITRLLYIYCLDLMAQEEGVSLTEAEEAVLSEAAQVYMDTLTDADQAYLDVSMEEVAEYYGHFALAAKYYDLKTADVILTQTASSDAQQEALLEEAKADAISAEYEAFVAGVTITVDDEALSGESDETADVTTNQFFAIYNEFMADD